MMRGQRFIIESQGRSRGQRAETGKGIVTGQAAKTIEVVLSILVVWMVRPWRLKASRRPV
jgi:hypothetical protein